ncbi:MAG: FecR domain-containing protein [Gemmatimonadota bacterium]
MPATFTPISPEVFAGVRQGAETALERLFREHYNALIDEATEHVDEAASAPRVVQTALLRTWDKREDFQSPEALEAFLHSAIHEAAIREKSRRAGLHRLESHEGVAHVVRRSEVRIPTVDEAWGHLTAALHPPPHDAAHAADVATASRHAAAEHMAAVGKRSSPLATMGYIGAIVLAVAALLFGIFRESPEAKVTRFLKSSDSREIISKFGQIGTVTLDDGSKATIGADSRLLIPPGFPSEVRAVRVTGTGTFDVATATLPFEVRLGEVAVVATGTRFAVDFDTATHAALVRVDEGTVKVRVGKTEHPLAAGQALAVDANGVTSEPPKSAIDEALAWTNGRLVVSDRTLRHALEQTRRWYAIALVPHDMSLMERKVSIDAPLDSSTVMISELERSGNMKFGWEDKTMVLYDAGTAPTPKKK